LAEERKNIMRNITSFIMYLVLLK